MPQPRKHENDAAKARAYRDRQRQKRDDLELAVEKLTAAVAQAKKNGLIPGVLDDALSFTIQTEDPTQMLRQLAYALDRASRAEGLPIIEEE